MLYYLITILSLLDRNPENARTNRKAMHANGRRSMLAMAAVACLTFSMATNDSFAGTEDQGTSMRGVELSESSVTGVARADGGGDGVSRSKDSTRVRLFDMYRLHARDVSTRSRRDTGFAVDDAHWVARTLWVLWRDLASHDH